MGRADEEEEEEEEPGGTTAAVRRPWCWMPLPPLDGGEEEPALLGEAVVVAAGAAGRGQASDSSGLWGSTRSLALPFEGAGQELPPLLPPTRSSVRFPMAAMVALFFVCWCVLFFVGSVSHL
jgi:hypothetical protein